MTEEDTFKKLKKVPFLEMEHIINQDLATLSPGVDINARKATLLKEYGWTASEYNTAILCYEQNTNKD